MDNTIRKTFQYKDTDGEDTVDVIITKNTGRQKYSPGLAGAAAEMKPQSGAFTMEPSNTTGEVKDPTMLSLTILLRNALNTRARLAVAKSVLDVIFEDLETRDPQFIFEMAQYMKQLTQIKSVSVETTEKSQAFVIKDWLKEELKGLDLSLRLAAKDESKLGENFKGINATLDNASPQFREYQIREMRHKNQIQYEIYEKIIAHIEHIFKV